MVRCIILLVALIVPRLALAESGNWVLRGTGTKSQCVVQRATDSGAKYPIVLATTKSSREACEEAIKRKSADMGADGKDCPAFPKETTKLCSEHGIKLE
jgi:hypothetical protein